MNDLAEEVRMDAKPWTEERERLLRLQDNLSPALHDAFATLDALRARLAEVERERDKALVEIEQWRRLRERETGPMKIRWPCWLRAIRYRWQRSQRGWADCDVWNLDTYLARVIAGSVTRLRLHHHGYPSSLGDDGDEQWSVILERIASAYQKYDENWEDTGVTPEMKELLDWFPSLWD